MHQITEAMFAGYDKNGIVNSVIRAMAPILALRNILEINHNVILKKLSSSLRHYDERNATDLCSKLTSLTQLPDGTAYSFVMKYIELLQKILLASSKSGVKYDREHALKLFIETLDKGITSTYILSEIRDLLRKGVSDEDLIEAITRAFPSEEERIAIQSKAKTKANKVYEVGVSKDSTGSRLLSTVKNLTNHVVIMQSELNEFKSVNRKIYYHQYDGCK